MYIALFAISLVLLLKAAVAGAGVVKHLHVVRNLIRAPSEGGNEQSWTTSPTSTRILFD